MEMAGGIRNAAHLLLWTQQIQMNAPMEVSMCVELDLTVDFTGNLGMANTVQRLNATLARANVEGRRFDEVRVAKICCPAWIAALKKYIRKSFVAVGLAAPDVHLGPELRGGRMNPLQLEHSEEMMASYEVFPERITSTPIFQNAAAKWAAFQENAQQDKHAMYTQGARLVGALGDTRRKALTLESAAADRDSLATKAASLVFGQNPPEDAVAISKLLLQASTFVQEDEHRQSREDDYQRRMPAAAGNIDDQMQRLREAGIAAMHEKLKSVKRSFEIVTEHAQVIQKACSKFETQWQPLSDKQALTSADVKKLQALLETISKDGPKLDEKQKALEAELAKKIQSRTKFIESCSNDFVPEAALKEVMGENLDEDWGTGQQVTITGSAVARLVEFVFVQVGIKFMAHVQVVDDDVRAVLIDMFGDDGWGVDDVELPGEQPQ